MRVKSICGVAGVVGALLVSTTAQAALTGIKVAVKQSQTNPRLFVCDLYVTFSAAGDNLIAIVGLPAPGAQLSYSTNSIPGFHQETLPLGIQDTPVAGPLLTFAPVYESDTYITIGLKSGYATGALTMQSIGIFGVGDPTTWNAGGSLLSNAATGGTYFVLPGAPEAVEVGGQVLIAQLVIDGNALTTDGLAARIDVFIPEITWADAAGNSQSTTGLFSSSHTIPAPGTLALLGLAGLAGIRRRRR